MLGGLRQLRPDRAHHPGRCNCAPVPDSAPKRWIVERTLAWISRCRWLARTCERHARIAAAYLRLAMIRLMLRRAANH
jgi:hypothetical protein